MRLQLSWAWWKGFSKHSWFFYDNIYYITLFFIYQKSEEEHAPTSILFYLCETKVVWKCSKCKFWLTSVAFLGHVVSKEGVMVVVSQNIEAIRNLIQSIYVTKIRSFVGLARYYREFMKNIASITTHLTNLTKKVVPF